MTSANDLPKKSLLRPDEVAAFFSVARSTVYFWYETGHIEGVKAGGKTLRIFRDSVIRLIKAGKQ